jgi:hypothetical protein
VKGVFNADLASQLQIVKNFKNGVKDLDKYGCSPGLKRWIAELAHDMHVNGRGPRPLDMKMIKKPPLVSQPYTSESCKLSL